MSRWQAIIFDLDDTLYPEREYVRSGMRAVAVWAQRRLRLPAKRSFAELWELFEQGVRGDTFDRWLAVHGLGPDERVAAMVRVYRGHRPQISPYPETRSLLRRLRLHYRLGLVTDGPLQVQQRKLAALGLQRCFRAVVYSDALGRNAFKPSSRPFETVLQKLSVAAGHAVHVADNPIKDFRGPRRIGMGTIRVRHPQGLYCELEPPGPDDAPGAEIPALGNLEAALDALPSPPAESKSSHCISSKAPPRLPAKVLRCT